MRVNWSADELRHLRYRLGWSRAELARSLGCEISVVFNWETGGLAPDTAHRNHLLHFFHQAEVNAESVQRRPVAELLMNSRGLAQIHESEVMDCLAGGELRDLSFKP
jgi:transcriptional regulator with XRE-family HTH domain